MNEITLSVAIGNLIVAIIIFAMFVRILDDLKGSRLWTPAILLTLTGFTFAVHALSEVMGQGEIVYAVTASLTTILFLSAIYYTKKSTEVVPA